MNWLPIESAPEQQFVLIAGGTFWWDGNGKEYPYAEVTIGYLSYNGWCGGYCGNNEEEFWHKPTHWMPLPEPPK